LSVCACVCVGAGKAEQNGLKQNKINRQMRVEMLVLVHRN